LKSTLNDYETNKTKTKVTMNELISKLKNWEQFLRKLLNKIIELINFIQLKMKF
jgi:cell fate (sporulation/competence/biofilm development) regulator YlbF (YheA/YmcA/DUF963 family)